MENGVISLAQDELGPVMRPENPLPPGGDFAWLHRGGGVRLRYAKWRPDPSRRDHAGSVVVIPGRTEFIEKYFEVVGELLRRGFHVAVLDLRGQGLSTRPLANPMLGHADDFTEYVADLDAWMSVVVVPLLPPPRIALAHSLGAHILLRFLMERPSALARAVLTSPMTGIRTKHLNPAWGERLIKALARVRGATSPVPSDARADPLAREFEGNAITGDRTRFERQMSLIRADPRLALGTPTWGWLAAAFRSMRVVSDRRRLARISTPVLIVSAENDCIVDNRSHKKLAAALPHAELATVANARHEILMERDPVRREFWGVFDRFVACSENRADGTRSG